MLHELKGARHSFTDGNNPTLHTVITKNPIISNIKKNRSHGIDASPRKSGNTYARPVPYVIIAFYPKKSSTNLTFKAYIAFKGIFSKIDIIRTNKTAVGIILILYTQFISEYRLMVKMNLKNFYFFTRNKP